jgi:nitrogenase-associated protein
MAEVTFYEKPGCSGNARQKQVLAAAGHTVLARDLRSETWTRIKLLAFFSSLPISAWFNRNAPAVKSGQVNPDELDETAALALLIANPLLIRRPLLQVGDERRVGFDAAAISSWIGLGEAANGEDHSEDLEACRRKTGESCTVDEHEASAASESANTNASFVATAGGGAMLCQPDTEPQHGQACRCGK